MSIKIFSNSLMYLSTTFILFACTTTAQTVKIEKHPKDLLIGNWICESVTGTAKDEYHSTIQSTWRITEDRLYEEATLKMEIRFDANENVGRGTVHGIDIDSYKWVDATHIAWIPLQYDIKLTENSPNTQGEFIKYAIYPSMLKDYASDIQEKKEYVKKVIQLDEARLVVQEDGQAEKRCNRVLPK